MSSTNETGGSKCPVSSESKCPMKSCPYVKSVTSDDVKKCPYLQNSGCPYLNDKSRKESLNNEVTDPSVTDPSVTDKSVTEATSDKKPNKVPKQVRFSDNLCQNDSCKKL